MEVFDKTFELPYHPDQRELWKTGTLPQQWYNQYPFLFDEEDFRLANSQPESHFFEWLSAITMYNLTGFLSLVEKYQFKKHEKKQKILDKLKAQKLKQLFKEQNELGFGSSQPPDLLLYRHDYLDWFFSEVKMKEENFTARQREYFPEVKERTGKMIYLIEFFDLGE